VSFEIQELKICC